MNNGEAILTAALAEVERLKIELHETKMYLARANAQFAEMAKIVNKCLASAIVKGGKLAPKPITAADAQIGEQIN